jgi:hypothetical protein
MPYEGNTRFINAFESGQPLPGFNHIFHLTSIENAFATAVTPEIKNKRCYSLFG